MEDGCYIADVSPSHPPTPVTPHGALTSAGPAPGGRRQGRKAEAARNDQPGIGSGHSPGSGGSARLGSGLGLPQGEGGDPLGPPRAEQPQNGRAPNGRAPNGRAPTSEPAGGCEGNGGC